MEKKDKTSTGRKPNYDGAISKLLRPTISRPSDVKKESADVMKKIGTGVPTFKSKKANVCWLFCIYKHIRKKL